MNSEINQKFKSLFNFEKENFFSIKDLAEDSLLFGFSLQKNPKDKLKTKANKKYISLIYIYAENKEQNNPTAKIPLIIRIDLALKDEEKLLSEDKYIKNKIKRPINIISENEYFYAPETSEISIKNKIITPDKFLKEIYNLHIKPTRLIVGFYLRQKLIIRTLGVFLVNQFSNLLILVLLIFSGEKYSYDVDKKYWDFTILEKYKKQSDNTNNEKMDFFGNKIPTRFLIVYSSMHLLAYFMCYFFNFKPEVLKNIFENNFLIAIYIILSLSILQTITSEWYKNCIKKISIAAYKIKIKAIKV